MGFLTGFVTGAAGQANENFAEARKYQDQEMLRRQALVDKVAGEQSQIDAQAHKIALTQNTLKAQYGIDDDLAYTLATDPSFDKMSPDVRADYVRRMKPTNNYTTAVPASGGQPVPGSGFYRDYGALTGGTVNVPPVAGAVYPGTGPHRVYSAEPPKPNYRSMYGPFPAPRDDNQAAAQAKLAQLDVPGVDPKQISPDLVQQAYGKDPKEAKSNAMTKTIDLIAAGHITDPGAAEKVYEGLGGKPKDFDWSLISQRAKDPVFEQKVAELERIGVPHDMAIKLQTGAIHVTHHPTTGEAQAVDLTTGKLIDPTITQKIINPQPANPATQNNGASSPQPQQNTNPSSPPMQQNNAAPTQTNDVGAVTGVQPQPIRPNPQGWVTKPVYDQMSKELVMAPQALSKLRNVETMISNNPYAVGIPGHAIENIGGVAVTAGNILGGTGAGNAIDKWMGQSEVKGFKAAMDDLRASLPRPITQDETGGRISNYEREQIANILSDDHWTDTPQSATRTLGYVKNLLYKTIAGNINAIYPSPNDLVTNQQAQASRFNFLTKQLNLSAPDAYAVLAQEMSVKQGKGLQ